MTAARRAVIACGAAVTALTVLLPACTDGGDDVLPVALPPSPGPATQRFCERLAGRLPDELGTLARRRTEPDTDAVAAWGDPAVVLRCGVAPVQRPADDPFELKIAGVRWYPNVEGRRTTLTTLDVPVPVEVVVPDAYEAQVVARLADPLLRAASP